MKTTETTIATAILILCLQHCQFGNAFGPEVIRASDQLYRSQSMMPQLLGELCYTLKKRNSPNWFVFCKTNKNGGTRRHSIRRIIMRSPPRRGPIERNGYYRPRTRTLKRGW